MTSNADLAADTARLLARLRAIDEEAMYATPYLCEQAIKEAIFKIECLEENATALRSEPAAGDVERVALEKLVQDWTEASAACSRISDADAGFDNGLVAHGEAKALKDCAQDLRAALAAMAGETGR